MEADVAYYVFACTNDMFSPVFVNRIIKKTTDQNFMKFCGMLVNNPGTSRSDYE